MEMGDWHRGRTKRERSGRSILALYNVDAQGEVAVHMCGFHGIRRGNHFGRELIGRAELELRVDKGWR